MGLPKTDQQSPTTVYILYILPAQVDLRNKTGIPFFVVAAIYIMTVCI